MIRKRRLFGETLTPGLAGLGGQNGLWRNGTEGAKVSARGQAAQNGLWRNGTGGAMVFARSGRGVEWAVAGVLRMSADWVAEFGGAYAG